MDDPPSFPPSPIPSSLYPATHSFISHKTLCGLNTLINIIATNHHKHKRLHGFILKENFVQKKFKNLINSWYTSFAMSWKDCSWGRGRWGGGESRRGRRERKEREEGEREGERKRRREVGEMKERWKEGRKEGREESREGEMWHSNMQRIVVVLNKIPWFSLLPRWQSTGLPSCLFLSSPVQVPSPTNGTWGDSKSRKPLVSQHSSILSGFMWDIRGSSN